MTQTGTLVAYAPFLGSRLDAHVGHVLRQFVVAHGGGDGLFGIHKWRDRAINKVVVDTNIFVAAGFNPRSSSAGIIELIRDGSVALVWNDATLRETAKIVRQIPRLSWEQFAPLFRDEHESTADVDEASFRHIEDRDDRKFAALARASQAVLISNDAHLLSQRDRLEIQVMQPSEFLRALAES